MFTVFGVAYSFGVFFQPMASEFHASRSATSAVFAITAFLYFGLGSVSGVVADRAGPRRVVLAGAAAMVAGLLVTAAAPSIWVAYAGYGLGVGIGTACAYVPMVACVGAWYRQGRSLAIGVAVTGIGLGTLLVPPLAAWLIAAGGWRRAYVLLAAGSGVVLVAAALLARRPPQPAGGAPARPARALRQASFWQLYACGILVSFALFIAFVHLAPFAASRGASPVAAAYLIGLIGLGSIGGRLALGGLAGRWGSVRTYQAATALLGGSFAVWLLLPAYPGLAAFALLLGAGYGGWVALSPSVAADLYGVDGLGGTVGLLYTSAAVGSLLGPPFAGLVVDRTGGYTAAIALALVLGVAGLAPVLALPARVVLSDLDTPHRT